MESSKTVQCLVLSINSSSKLILANYVFIPDTTGLRLNFASPRAALDRAAADHVALLERTYSQSFRLTRGNSRILAI